MAQIISRVILCSTKNKLKSVRPLKIGLQLSSHCIKRVTVHCDLEAIVPPDFHLENSPKLNDTGFPKQFGPSI